MTIEWIAKKLGTDIPDPQRINPDDFVDNWQLNYSKIVMDSVR